MDRKGFTLIELIVVIAIISVLAAVVAPTAFRSIEKARTAGVISDYKSVKTASYDFFSDTRGWVATCGTAVLCQASEFFVAGASAGWDGPYLERWPLGRWTGDVTYTSAAGAVFGANAQERYITIVNVPASQQAKIDMAIDGVGGLATGMVRCAGTTCNLLISRDGAIN
jgi:general secretion pathway protein G